MLKRVLFALVVVLLLAGVYVVVSQSPACVPGQRDVESNGRVLPAAWVTCVRAQYTNEPGLLPIGTNVNFMVNEVVTTGEVAAYQWTQYPEQWPLDQRRPVVYIVNYPGGVIGITPDELEGANDVSQ